MQSLREAGDRVLIVETPDAEAGHRSKHRDDVMRVRTAKNSVAVLRTPGEELEVNP